MSKNSLLLKMTFGSFELSTTSQGVSWYHKTIETICNEILEIGEHRLFVG